MCHDKKVFFYVSNPYLLQPLLLSSIALPLLRLVFLLFGSEKNIGKNLPCFSEEAECCQSENQNKD
jgi:hypothetical protein